jgi:prenyltransferase beta subunit
MRLASLLLLAFATPLFAQTDKVDAKLKQHLETLKYVQSLHDAESGAFRVQAGGKPSLRAVNGALRVYSYLNAADHGMPYPTPEKTKEFVLKCYDEKTGSFAEPGSKPDIAINGIAIIAAAQLEIPKEKYKGAMLYLKANAKSFEDVRIGGAAVEAWGVKDCPFDLQPWHDNADHFFRHRSDDLKDGGARDLGSYVAFKLRIGAKVDDLDLHVKNLQAGQREDGAWGKAGAKTSDFETTYRVMRALYLAKAKPKNPEALLGYMSKCRNADGGYGVTPGEASSLSGVYYFAVVSKWLAAK